MSGFHNAPDVGQLLHDLELERQTEEHEKEFAKGMAALFHAKEKGRLEKEVRDASCAHDAS